MISLHDGGNEWLTEVVGVCWELKPVSGAGTPVRIIMMPDAPGPMPDVKESSLLLIV